MQVAIKIFAILLLVHVSIQWDRPKPAERDQFPHVASLWWGIPPEIPVSHSCGGAIISEFWILTSGYCVGHMLGHNHKIIKVGIYDVATPSEHVQSLHLKKGIIHEKYIGTNQIGNLAPYDIGLLRTQEEIHFNSHVKPALLPRKTSFLKGKYKLEYNLVLSGWGIIAFGVYENHPTIMYTLNLPVVPNKVCQDSIRHVIQNFELDKSTQMCTRPLDGSAGACTGDYGGPLVQYEQESSQPVVVGIMSWGIMPCDTAHLAPVYARVPHFVSWIKKKMKARE